jgi:hypothetical protein
MNDADVLRAAASVIHDTEDLPGNRAYRADAWRNASENLAKLIEKNAGGGPVQATAGLFTRDEVNDATDAAVDLLVRELGLGGRDMDLLRLMASATAGTLDDPAIDLDSVITCSYDDVPSTVRGWWNGWAG